MIVPLYDQTAVCRTARTVVWEGLILWISLYPIMNDIDDLLIGNVKNRLFDNMNIIYVVCDMNTTDKLKNKQ